ncbi:hypothetical protein T4E_7886 [Trichinella pseudospiralis]|uniref:Uncharacterized protein n=1 Tax=Trichinella pseudospiralis TaxID=6337 RepID=A0A0V0XV24_TRIPS|nr:hypothetical protein T4E_7886 [Trichinella pseudospiralis]
MCSHSSHNNQRNRQCSPPNTLSLAVAWQWHIDMCMKQFLVHAKMSTLAFLKLLQMLCDEKADAGQFTCLIGF